MGHFEEIRLEHEDGCFKLHPRYRTETGIPCTLSYALGVRGRADAPWRLDGVDLSKEQRMQAILEAIRRGHADISAMLVMIRMFAGPPVIWMPDLTTISMVIPLAIADTMPLEDFEEVIRMVTSFPPNLIASEMERIQRVRATAAVWGDDQS